MACAGSVGLAVPQLSPWDGTSGACAAPAAPAAPADTGAVSHTAVTSAGVTPQSCMEISCPRRCISTSEI